MGTFDLNLDERVKSAEEAIDLNKVVNGIIKEFSYQLTDDISDNYNMNLNILANQVVGAEVR